MLTDIGYMYQDMEELQKEEMLETQENSDEEEDVLDSTVVGQLMFSLTQYPYHCGVVFNIPVVGWFKLRILSY